ncbi:MAG: TRAP transporter TatT component family protein [Desulfohalobiaceae bacterium]|nr:TRAP transporter TatT component family protein [Desulfohalobiaceae bacterium]
MSKVRGLCLLLLIGILCGPATAWSGDMLAKADRLYANGTTVSLKQAVKRYKRVAAENPESYEARWKGARACRSLSEQAKLRETENWKDICAEYGKQGMKLAKEAVELRPQGVEGHYFYGVCVGSYSDGVSIFTALSEGLKDKTRTHLKKAYELDKRYNDATPPMALGRYYEVLPWLAGQDKDKALEYYREALRLMPGDSPHRPKLHVYAGRLMLDQGVEEKRARRLLREAAESSDPHFSDKAREILEENN